MKKWRYAAIPIVAFVVVYFVERTGYVRYGPDDPATPADQIDWGNIVVRWLIVMAIYFSLELFRSRRKGQRTNGEAA
ncbi:hypothetical protein [uncultured Pseudokineococcus sp.]|uniref:hypothetical protein n=1 Tax=uncultured Pseudokineococcus sp. TaxID=1642928 RepID=UPI002611F91F|nr:hypothetical protein [uncultured Pseudokineococcus sp.]